MSGGNFTSTVGADGHSYADDFRSRSDLGSFDGSPDNDVRPSPDVRRTSIEYLAMDIEAATPTIDPNAIARFVIGRQRIVSPQCIWWGNQRIQYEKSVEVDTQTVTETVPVEYGTMEVERVIETKKVTYKPVDVLITVVLGLCLGPRVRLKAIYSENKKIWEGNTTDGRNTLTIDSNEPFSRCFFHSGQLDAVPDPYLAQLLGDKVPGFVGLSYVVIPTIPSKKYSSANLSFEVERVDFNTRIDDDLPSPADEKGDINAAEFAFQIVRSQWSALGVKPKYIDRESFKDFFALCAERGWYFSGTFGDEVFGTGVLEDILSYTKSIMYVDLEEEKIKIKSMIAADFDEADAVILGVDQVSAIQEIDRTDWNQLPTHFRLEYSPRKNSYKRTPIQRKSLSLDLDDVMSEWRQLRINGAWICQEKIAKKILRQFIMENGWPRLSVTFRANTEGNRIKIGDGFILNLPTHGIKNEPFWATSIKHTSTDINEVVITGKYIGRPDTIDIDDDINDEPEDFSDYTPYDPTVIKPTTYKAYSVNLPVNFVYRQGRTTTYTGMMKQFAVHPVLFVRAENDAQAGFDLLTSDGEAAHMLNMPFTPSGYLVNGIAFEKGREDGYIGDVEISDPTGFASIDPNEQTLIQCGEAEWMAFTGYTVRDNGNIILHDVERCIWASLPEEHPPGSIMWCVNDEPRLLPPVTASGIKNFVVVPFTAEQAGTIEDHGLPIYVEYWPHMGVARPPSRVYLNGNRVYYDDEPITLYLGEPVKLTWINQSRTSTSIDGIGHETTTRENRGPSATYKDRYWIDIMEPDSYTFVWLGVTDNPSGPATDFGFNYCEFTPTLDDFDLGENVVWKIMIQHFIEAGVEPYIVNVVFAEKPELISDFDFSYNVRFAAEFKFGYELLSYIPF